MIVAAWLVYCLYFDHFDVRVAFSLEHAKEMVIESEESQKRPQCYIEYDPYEEDECEKKD